jgi:hypothetical protein
MALLQESFKLFGTCPNDETTEIFVFQQNGHGIFSMPATAHVYAKIRNNRIIWVKGFVAYSGL